MPRATVLLRPSSYYRADVFREGLRRHGYRIEAEWIRQPGPGDVLVLWNRNRGYESIAQTYERAGAKVIIAENGYVGQPEGGGKFYALALGQHNGAGRWYVGESKRFPIDERPWRQRGDHVLVLPQRGIGARGVAMPSAWLAAVKNRLAKITDRPIRVRPHPGQSKADPIPDLLNAHCAVTWASGAGIKSIQAGVPVFHELPDWIGSCAATRLADQIETCDMPSREILWTRISWAQWTLAEIETGVAFERLLHAEDRDLFCARQSQIGTGRAVDVSRCQGAGLAA